MRHNLDRYDSPIWYGTVALEHVLLKNGINQDLTIFEPCTGSNVLANFFNKVGYRVVTSDIDESVAADFHGDATDLEVWRKVNSLHYVDWVITNPPFNVATPIIKHAYRIARKGIIFFLRTTWDEPCTDRGDWLFNRPMTRKITLPRFAFKKVDNRWATDACTISMYVWEFSDENYGQDTRQTRLERSLSLPKDKISLFYPNPEQFHQSELNQYIDELWESKLIHY